MNIFKAKAQRHSVVALSCCLLLMGLISCFKTNSPPISPVHEEVNPSQDDQSFNSLDTSSTDTDINTWFVPLLADYLLDDDVPPTTPEPPLPDNITWDQLSVNAGDLVTIPVGQTVLLEGTTPELAGLIVMGTLILDGVSSHLTSEWIKVSGSLLIGEATEKFQGQSVITLTGHPENAATEPATRGIMVMDGGRFEVYAESPATSWTKLGANVERGSSQLTLAIDTNWQVGNTIAIASTDFDFQQAEERKITAVTGKTIELDSPLDYPHWGEYQTIAGQRLDMRGEVALLNRNVRIESIDDIHAQEQGFGGHIMAMAGSSMKLDGIELKNMGQRAVMGRYPIHWHLAGDATGDFVKRTSIHHSFSRCVTIHGTHNVLIEDTVSFETFGHCYFLEDGIEQGNRFNRVLGMNVRKPEVENALLSSDTQFPGPTVFWITNPDNTFTYNSAAGSEGSGFWYALAEHPTGPSATETVYPRAIPLATFKNNVTHSNKHDGLHVDRGPNIDTFELESSPYRPVTNPADPQSTPVTAVFENFTAYKTRNRAVWLRGRNHIVRNGIFSDNSIGVTLASRDSHVEDSIFVGESANMGDPRPWEITGPIDGRSIPLPWTCDNCSTRAIRGFEMYDGTVGVKSSTFVNFTPNSLRNSGAIGQLDFTEFFVSPENWVEDLTISANSNKVFLYTPEQLPSKRDGYQSTMFIDIDGSVTGQPNRAVVVDQPIMLTDECIKRAEWQAWDCPNNSGQYASLRLDTVNEHLETVDLSHSGLSANSMVGSPSSNNYQSNLVISTDRWYEYNYAEDPTHVRLNLFQAKVGDTIQLSLPYTRDEVFIYRDRNIHSTALLNPVASLELLEASNGDSYFKSTERVYFKLQVREGKHFAAADVCVATLCTGSNFLRFKTKSLLPSL